MPPPEMAAPPAEAPPAAPPAPGPEAGAVPPAPAPAAPGLPPAAPAPAPMAEGEEVEAIPAAMAEETEVEVTKEEETPIKDEVAAKIEEKMAMLFAAIEECAAEISKVKEEMSSMKTKMEKFAKAPAGTKIPKATDTTTEKFDAVEAKVAALKELRKEFVK